MKRNLVNKTRSIKRKIQLWNWFYVIQRKFFLNQNSFLLDSPTMLPTVSGADPKPTKRLSPISSYNGFEQVKHHGKRNEPFTGNERKFKQVWFSPLSWSFLLVNLQTVCSNVFCFSQTANSQLKYRKFSSLVYSVTKRHKTSWSNIVRRMMEIKPKRLPINSFS